MKAIADQAAQEILTRGITDIEAAGRYGHDWTGGLHVNVEEEGQGDAVIRTSHDKPYYNFLNVGGPIKGSPLLWLPTDNNPTFGEGVSPRDYPGKLVETRNQEGIPLLIDPTVPKGRAVMYIGELFVIMPRKFHILDIIRDVAKDLKRKYKITYSTSR
jgi:hypothetical protein